MQKHFAIAGYCRISVDDELDRDNVSIENQKSIIGDFVETHFPGSTLTFFEDRDRSGYTFEQREGYQTLRRSLMDHTFDILIVKDFSRFSRRNSRGLVELEDLRDAGVRMISIGDGIDFPNDDDWLKIQFQFLINEMPVTDTSKKVRSVIRRRQAEGEWICAAPYGYIINKRKEFEVVPAEAEVVRRIFELYNREGWGYRKIANHLTAESIPTPRMSEQLRKESEGGVYRRTVRSVWAIVTVQGILDNDFYIGTLRQGKYTRTKINGRDTKKDASEVVVIENHHPAIIDRRTFLATRSLRETRSRSHYRGYRIHDNSYSGFLTCGDCGSPMFSMSRRDLSPAYICGSYHRRGRAGCTSHHIRTDSLDEMLREYLRRILSRSADMVERLNHDLERKAEDGAQTERGEEQLEELLKELQEELRTTKRQRIRDLMKHPDRESLLEDTYDVLEEELHQKIKGLTGQLALLGDRRDTAHRVRCAAGTAGELFRAILARKQMDRCDLELLVRQIFVYEDHIEVKLQADIDALLHSGIPESTADFKRNGEADPQHCLVQPGKNHRDKIFNVHVVNDGDPLEIYTSKEGEVIFKKYSLMGDIDELAAQFCEALSKNSGSIVAVSDRDTVIAVAGGGRRELLQRRLSARMEEILEDRKLYQSSAGTEQVRVTEDNEQYTAYLAAPVISQGDMMGSVLFIAEGEKKAGPVETALAEMASTFLGRHLEN